MLEEFTACVPLSLDMVLRGLSETLDDLLEECVELSEEIKDLRAQIDAEL